MFTSLLFRRVRQVRRRFGTMAPRVVIRPFFSWPWYVATVLLILGFLVLADWFLFRRSEVGFVDQEMERLQQQAVAQQDQVVKLRSLTGTEQYQVRVERSAQKVLAARIESLERENASLKEDIRLFERLMPTSGEEAQISVENFKLSLEPDGLYRYRLLLAFRPGKGAPEFKGRLQLVAIFIVDGREQILSLPEGRGRDSDFAIEVKHFLRQEGTFGLPSGAKIKALEARVLQGSLLKIKRFAQL